MNEYERQPYGASGMDVLGAWALAAVVFLGLLLLSIA
jgi:hypothetical protein